MQDFRISRSSVAGLGDDDFFWALIRPIWPDETVVDEEAHVANGTPGQRALYSTTLFIRDVDNRGVEQALWNLDARFIALVLDSFERLGAREHAQVLRAAIDGVFGPTPPPDLETRRNILDALDPERRAELDSLSERLYSELRLRPFFRRYVEAYPEDFFLPD